MKMTNLPVSADLIAEANAREVAALEDDYGALGRKLARSGIAIDAIKNRVANFSVAVPSWGAGRGGTRFAKFPIAGEPTNIHEKLEDCAVINQLSRVTPRVSPHFPWDKVSDYKALREEAASLGLGFDAVNSNTFQDQPGQAQTYATGSLSSTVEATRQQAVEHNIECIEIGRQLGSTDLTFPASRTLPAVLIAILKRRRRSMPRCRVTGGCCWNTRCSSRPSIRP